MTSSAIVSRYAGALADVVTGPRSPITPEKAGWELRSFEAVLASSSELRNALTSPGVPAARKKAVVARIAGRLELSGVPRNFLNVLIDHRRIAALEEILTAFEIELDKRLGFVRADVVSARPIADAQRAALAAELERVAGMKVRLKFSEDSDLIGGIVARIGSTVYDGSVRGQLESLGRRLTTEQ